MNKQSERLFGTDGIRGKANELLTPDFVLTTAMATGHCFISSGNLNPVFIIGKDTRLSSNMISSSLAAGLSAVGAKVIHVDVVPTPAIPFLVKELGADAGIMVSASHNSFEYNGIKIFDREGFKISDNMELQIEALIMGNIKNIPLAKNQSMGRILEAPAAYKLYIDHLVATLPSPLNGLKVGLDLANGSAVKTAREIFSRLNIDAHFIHDKPNGININKSCGSTDTSSLSEFVVAKKLSCGFAFDGDADRCFAVDEKGNLVDGDKIMALCAFDLKNRKALNNNGLVATVMSNLGLKKFCKEKDIDFHAANVGDRHVLEKMLNLDMNFGGEQSGHIIFKDFATTGDGQLTAIQLLSLMSRKGKSLSELSDIYSPYPQISITVPACQKEKEIFVSSSAVDKTIDKFEKSLSDNGRILVRPSGTENLIRIMVEGKDKLRITKIANRIQEEILKAIS